MEYGPASCAGNITIVHTRSIYYTDLILEVRVRCVTGVPIAYGCP